MNQDDFTQDIQDKARQIAALLSAATPYERSLILHEAQFLCDEEQAARLSIKRVPESEAHDDVVAMNSTLMSRYN